MNQRAALDPLPGGWADFLTASAMIRIAERRSEAQQMLRSILASNADENDTVNARRVLAQNLMGGTKEDLQEAVDLMLGGLEETPDYWPYANNIAVLYAKEMGRTEDALTFAERARDLAPDTAFVLDTLGYIYGELGRYEESESAFARAVETARDLEMRMLAILHLGQMFQKKGDKTSAQQVIERLDALRTEMLPNAPKDPDLEELREQVRNM